MVPQSARESTGGVLRRQDLHERADASVDEYHHRVHKRLEAARQATAHGAGSVVGSKHGDAGGGVQ